ncbi:galactose oxidase-like domain-containing protein [Deinococcus peraridilitoris]|uniref:galactose oxidase-like domain-containing protein n=1 Tax=Deinococcus peraridilitoris TaxID=432329 RepID=UPI0003078E4E|nr:galactose oxidase-like domain-containing protein [Deinococcus peraridilitoris]
MVPAQDYEAAKSAFGPPSADASSKGQWSTLIGNWPVLAIHTTLLPDGTVMSFGGNYYPDWANYAGKSGVPYNNQIDLWNPANNTHTPMNFQGSAIFCGGHTLLADGRLLIAGGDDLSKLFRHRSAEAGIKDTNIYDYRTKKWTKVASMSEFRWYPTTTTLPNGDVLAVAGNSTVPQGQKLGAGTFAETPEVYNPTSNTWRRLDGAKAQTDFYPWLFVASNGQVFNAGPDKDEVGWIGTGGAGSWTPAPPPNKVRRDYGTAVMYDTDKVLVLGGGGSDERDNSPTSANRISPTNHAIGIDLSGGTAQYTTFAPMQYKRRFHNATLLPDGSVLVTGGTQAYGFNNAKYPPDDPENAAKAGQDATVKIPELWNPVSKSWTSLAPMTVERLYHSTAILLPDATVLVSGGGACTDGDPEYSGCPDEKQQNAGYDKYRNAQVYRPPYLFKGERPSIQGVSKAVIDYGDTFEVTTTDAAQIGKATLIRLGSVTHSFDMNQRISTLDIVGRSGGTLTLRAPGSPNLAPPGQYMLFILKNGVPSVSRIVTLK